MEEDFPENRYVFVPKRNFDTKFWQIHKVSYSNCYLVLYNKLKSYAISSDNLTYNHFSGNAFMCDILTQECIFQNSIHENSLKNYVFKFNFNVLRKHLWSVE